MIATSSTLELTRKFYDPLTDQDREKLKAIVLEKIRREPGTTSPQLMDFTGASLQEIKRALRFLRVEGKIRDRGWEPIGDSSRTNELNILEDSSRTNVDSKKDSSRDELTVKWKSPAGSAKTDKKYPWLYSGDRHLIYIGGGNQKHPIAKRRVAQIEKWIELKIPVDEIVKRIEMIKSGQWRLN